MSSSPSTPDDPGLFDDLPLHPEELPGRVAPAPMRPQPESPPTGPDEEAADDDQPAKELLLLFQEESEDEVPSAKTKAARKLRERDPSKSAMDLTRTRLVAGLIDFGVVLAVAISAVVCVAWMGVDLSPLPWAPLALFLAAFSFLYSVFPLAFWGRTPGMAWMGLRATSLDGQSLSFGQTTLRWLASLLTVATFGLPLILALKGTHLSDLFSQSQVESSAR